MHAHTQRNRVQEPERSYTSITVVYNAVTDIVYEKKHHIGTIHSTY